MCSSLVYIINSARMITAYHWEKKQPMSEQECPQPGGRVTEAVTELIFKRSSECVRLQNCCTVWQLDINQGGHMADLLGLLFRPFD